jgi:pimeloyl-ACP methyl ester carboxylesterase
LLGALRTPSSTEAKLAALERFADAGRPYVELRTGEEWGHHLALQAPDEVAALVVEWLTSRR